MAEPMAPDVVLITGSSTGMGLETSLYLAARNYKVYASVPFESDIPIVEAAASSACWGLNGSMFG